MNENEQHLVEALRFLFETNHGLMVGNEEVETVSTFDEAGLLTSNVGVVVTLTDGSQFQVPVIQSRQGVA